MVYSNTTTKDGIIQHIETLTDLGDAYISGTDTNKRYFNGIINRVAHRVWHTIFMATGNWSYDNGNYTDLPVATANLANDTGTYALPSEALTVKRLEIKNEDGIWHRLKTLTEERINGAIDEFQDTSGTPTYYTLKNGVVKLYPAPNYSQDDSLKIYFERTGVDFTYDDTTASPGFASPYHEIIPIGASIEWYKIKQASSPTLQGLLMDYQKLEQSIKEFYNKRFKDYTPRIGRKQQTFK